MPRRRQPTRTPYDDIPPSFRVCEECGSGVMDYDGKYFVCKGGHTKTVWSVLTKYKREADPD
jgi:hypothetical protein